MKKSYLNEITSKIPLSEAEQLPKDILDAEGIDAELDEISTTAGVPGYQTPYAFGKATDATVNMLGYKKVKKANKNVMAAESKFMQISKKLHLQEVSYKDYKNDTSISSKQKVNQAIHEVNKKMYQIEKIINQNLRLKNEMKLGNSEFWKSTNEKMYKISERLIRIAKNLKELNA